MKRAIYAALALTVLITLTGCFCDHGHRPIACVQGSCAKPRKTVPPAVAIIAKIARIPTSTPLAIEAAVSAAAAPAAKAMAVAKVSLQARP